MLDTLHDLFAPGGRHAEDERQRLEHTRVVEGDHGPGRGPIDLDGGDRGLAVLIALPPAILPARPRLEEGEEADEEEPA